MCGTWVITCVPLDAQRANAQWNVCGWILIRLNVGSFRSEQSIGWQCPQDRLCGSERQDSAGRNPASRLQAASVLNRGSYVGWMCWSSENVFVPLFVVCLCICGCVGMGVGVSVGVGVGFLNPVCVV
jgi:hypothetical protein